MESSNPALNSKAFSSAKAAYNGPTMTIQGTVNKAFILLAILMLTATWTWGKIGDPSFTKYLMPLMMGSGIVGFGVYMVTVFKKQWSSVTAPIYAACQGLVLGALSAIFEVRYPGIVIQAVGLTFGVLFCMLMAYKTGWIKATEGFKRGIFIATAAIAVFYLFVWIVSMFGITQPAFINGGGMLGIGFSLFVVGIATLNLILDFDFIEQASEAGVEKYMEWFAAFGLMITLIWLYMEILRLLSKISRRD